MTKQDRGKPMMRNLKLSVFGFGGVGRVLASHALDIGAAVSVLSDSSGVLVAKNESFSKTGLDAVSKAKETGKSLSQISKGGEHQFMSTEEYIKYLENLESTKGHILADCSAHADPESYLLPAQKLGIPVALANKKPVTGTYKHFQELTSSRNLIRMESTAGAGLPTVCTLQRLLESNDKIISIEGCMSGSLGYLMSALESGKKFSDTVLYAKEQGFLEPDPRDDLSGLDVARKAVILGRICGRPLDLESLNIESLYPKEFGELTVDGFLERLHELDHEFETKVKRAATSGKVLRYVASILEDSVEVGLKEVEKDSVLGRLQGTDNCVVYTTKSYCKEAGSNPLVVTGPGAGRDVTAQGVLADCVDLFHAKSN